MSRPQKERVVRQPPLHTDFKPLGIQRRVLESLPLGLDEFEALRLADYLGMEHTAAAMEMEISRSTFTRLIEKSRRKVAKFLVEGKHLHIEGGNIHFRGNIIKCHDCGHMFNVGFDSDINKCPDCESGDLLDLAGEFGHGNCCRGHGYHGGR